MPLKKGTSGSIEAARMELMKVKSKERRREIDVVLDGEVTNRCKNIGKKVAEEGSAPKVKKERRRS